MCSYRSFCLCSSQKWLTDKNEKKYYHVYPWETAEDLQFVSYGKHVEDNFPDPQNPRIKLNFSGNYEITLEVSNDGFATKSVATQSIYVLP